MQVLEWILKYCKEFQDKKNNEWCNEIYEPRHGKSIHNFELETISRATINLKKKKYLKALAFYKGRFYDDPKIAGTGIEIIKSTTPKLCREILTELTRSLVFETTEMDKESYIYYFNDKLANFKKKFYTAPIEDISMSIGVGDYKKYVIDDGNTLSTINTFNYKDRIQEQFYRVYLNKLKYNDSIEYILPTNNSLLEELYKTNKIIEFKNVVKEYRSGDHILKAMDNVNFTKFIFLPLFRCLK